MDVPEAIIDAVRVRPPFWGLCTLHRCATPLVLRSHHAEGYKYPRYWVECPHGHGTVRDQRPNLAKGIADN
jgi:hypothetical protein